MNFFDFIYFIFCIVIEYVSDIYVFIGNILCEYFDFEEMIGFNICLMVYIDEISIFLKVCYEFCQEDYECMIIDILFIRKILKRCRIDFQIFLNKKKFLIEKSRVMKILINMFVVLGYMVKNGNGYLFSLVVFEFCFFNDVD